MAYIQGERRSQGSLFPVVLDDLIPVDHRKADRWHFESDRLHFADSPTLIHHLSQKPSRRCSSGVLSSPIEVRVESA